MDGLDQKLMGFHLIAMQKLQDILILTGKCDLIIESDLIKGLELVCGAAWLRSKGVQKIYKFDPKQVVVAGTGPLVFFIRGSRLDPMKRVLEQIQSLRTRRAVDHGSGHFHIILLPNVEWKHEKLLEDEGMHTIVQLHRFSWDFVTLDTNLLSLELPEVFQQVFLAQDYTILVSIAKSLRIFNLITRTPNFVITLGDKSEKLWQMAQHLEQRKPSRNDDNPNAGDFSAMLLIDRDQDVVSKFLTPVTYTGLLAELYEMSAGHLLADQPNRIERGKLRWLGGHDPELPQTKQQSLKMNGAVDKTFADNRYLHFSQVITVLSVQAKALGLEGQYSKDMKVHEMKQFVEKLPKVAAAKKELVKHLNLCEIVVDELGKHFEMIQRVEENMILNRNRKQTLQEIEEVFLTLDMNKFVSLKLLVLFHLTFDMTEDELVTSIRNYFNTFGFENLYMVVQLIEVGLLPNSVLSSPGSSSTSSVLLQQQHKIKLKILNTLPKLQTPFQTHANKLKLIPATTDAKAGQSSPPNCPSYVFNRNYIPLVAQVVKHLCTSQSFDEFHSKICSLDMKISSKLSANTNIVESMTTAALNELIKTRKFPELLPLKPKTLMVFVLGGITYAEIAACDLVGQLTGCKVVMSSNRIVSGYDLLADLL